MQGSSGLAEFHLQQVERKHPEKAEGGIVEGWNAPPLRAPAVELPCALEWEQGRIVVWESPVDQG